MPLRKKVTGVADADKNGESSGLGAPVYGILVAEEAQDGLKCSSSSLYISTDNMMHLGTCFSDLIHDLCF